ncbi:hypothetical protein [Kitasatospora sp. NPDC001527]|uniref:hypothetical protein n=1 Tax=Kitasatospora sp. NPDC001527 TaxID=3154519 RepID=UPI00332EAD6C
MMTRALLAMDTAICLNTDGDPTAAATMAVDVWEHLPKAYRDGLVRTRAEGLRHALSVPARPGPRPARRSPGRLTAS